MSDSDITASVKNGILFLEDPFDQVFATLWLFIAMKLKPLAVSV